jgi:hypothetical protein
MLVLLHFNPQPESVPLMLLVAVKVHPMEEEKPVEIWEMMYGSDHQHHRQKLKCVYQQVE